MRPRTTSLATLVAALFLACNSATSSSASGTGGTASAISMGEPDAAAGAEQGGTSGGGENARGRYACPGVLGGAGTFGEVASGGVGGALTCVVGREYCEFEAYAGESGQPPGGVPFCIDFTQSAPSCSDAPNCACLCAHGTRCGDYCSCTDVDGLAIVYCQGI